MPESMLSTNVQIISELKYFLVETMSTPVLLDKYRFDCKAFTRNRILTFEVMVLFILHGLKRSLTIELQDFFRHFPQLGTCSKQAFSAGRIKLQAVFFHDWNHLLVEKYYSHCHRVKRWKGLLVYAIDGSSVHLPDTGELALHYGIATGSKRMQCATAMLSTAFDVLNKLVVNTALYHYPYCEREMALDHLNYIGKDSVTLFDRGYPAYWLFYYFFNSKPGSYFLMRCRGDFCKTMQAFSTGKSKDKIIEIFPSYKSIKKLGQMGIKVEPEQGIKLRVVKVILSTGKVEYLISNLYSTKKYSRKALVILYGMRWGVETYYGHLKNELQLEQFSGIRPIIIEQDFAANMLLFNLQSIIEKDCESYLKDFAKKRKYAYQINKNVSWAALKYGCVELILLKRTKEILRELQKYFQNATEPIRPGRKYSHKKKSRYEHGKYKTLQNYKRAL